MVDTLILGLVMVLGLRPSVPVTDGDASGGDVSSALSHLSDNEETRKWFKLQRCFPLHFTHYAPLAATAISTKKKPQNNLFSNFKSVW